MTLVRTPYPFQTFGSGVGGGGGVNSVVAGTDITITGPATDPVVNLSSTITSRPTFNPGIVQSPFQIGANGFDQLVARLNADLLDGSSAAAFAAATHTHAAGDIVSGQLALARGGTGADLSATGGSGHLVRQNSAGATFTVGRFLLTDLDDDLVTFAKLQNIATARLLGRTTAASGDIEELSVDASLTLAAGTLKVTQANKVVGFGGVASGPATSFATPSYLTGASSPAELVPCWDFDDTVTEYADFYFHLRGYRGGGLTILIRWLGASNTNNVRWGAAIRRIADDAEDLDTTAHSYDFNDVSADDPAPSAIGEVAYAIITFTDGADMDSLTDGEEFVLRIRRTAASSNMTGDARLLYAPKVLETA